jgi:hypothetical protein
VVEVQYKALERRDRIGLLERVQRDRVADLR